MYEIIVCICLLFFASVGFGVLLGKLWITMLKPKQCVGADCVVVLHKGNEISEVEYYIEKFKWYGSDFADNLYFVCKGKISEECLNLCRKLSNVYCCSYVDYNLEE